MWTANAEDIQIKRRRTHPSLLGRGQNGNTGEQTESSDSFPVSWDESHRVSHRFSHVSGDENSGGAESSHEKDQPPVEAAGAGGHESPSESGPFVLQSRAVTARIIDGKAVASQVESEVAASITRLGFHPGLVAIRVGSDPASEVYVRSKARKARELGLEGTELVFPETLAEAGLLAEIERLNGDDSIDGILVQLPLPRHIDAKKVIDAISPAKDVDGFHPYNVGLLHLGRPTLVPCTPAGVIRLIESTGEPIEGRRAVVIGRSDIVGKPLAALLLQRHATVTVCHSRTRDLPAVAREADILVAAIGRPFFVSGEMVKPGAIVIDVGINRVGPELGAALSHDESKMRILEKNGSVLVGDVDYVRAREHASWITPVPGGVGPMTIAMLMQNTVTAAEWRRT